MKLLRKQGTSSPASSYRMFYCVAAMLLSLCATGRSDGQAVTWRTNQSVTVEPSQVYANDPANAYNTWMRLVHLQDGSWLSATSMQPNTVTDPSTGQLNTYQFINIKQSFDDMRTWNQVTYVSEANQGRNLDNPVLAQLPDGTVVLSGRSVIYSVDTAIEVWTANLSQSSTFNSQGFIARIQNPNQTNCGYDYGKPMLQCGVWEPFLVVRPDGSLLIFYSDEGLQQQGYNQVITEKVSTDGGVTWTPEANKIIAVADVAYDTPIAWRPGMPYVTLMENGLYRLSYEKCDPNANGYGCLGGYKTSTDGVTWSSGIGSQYPGSGSNPDVEDNENGNVMAQSFSNGLLLVASTAGPTSGAHYPIYWSGDYGANWSPNPISWPSDLAAPNCSYCYWPSFYQTRTNEIAMVAQSTIVFGTMAPLPYHDAFLGNYRGDYTSYGTGSWSTSSGIMSVNTPAADDKLVLVGNTTGGAGEYGMNWRDYTLQGDVRLRAAGDAGFLVRTSSPTTGLDHAYAYYVGIGSTGVVFLGDMHNGYSGLGSATIAGGSAPNTWVHVTATVAGCSITITAVPVGSTSTPGTFSVNDCSHLGGTIGLRTDGIAADWRNVAVNETGANPGSNAPYFAPWANTNPTGWSQYGGTWNMTNGLYQVVDDGQGDKSVEQTVRASNAIVQSDVQVSATPNSGILLGVSNPQTGVDQLTGYFIGTGPQSLFLGQEANNWTGLTGTNYENPLSAGNFIHITAQVRNCQFTLAAQPLTLPYGYFQTYIAKDCSTSGRAGVREFKANTNFQNFSVLPN
jgi:hypothetical protein